MRWLADENFNNDIVRGLRRRNLNIDIVRVQDVGLTGIDDEALLAWAAEQDRVLLTHDVSTITAFAYRRIMRGDRVAGVFEVSRSISIRSAIEDILLATDCSVPGGWEARFGICNYNETVTSRQFACLDCKQYINAGYRWCYTQLERPGIVIPGELLDAGRVLATAEYWAISAAGHTTTAWLDSLPPQLNAFLQTSPLLQTPTEWLEKLLPEVHAFLLFHRTHELRFGEKANEHFYSGPDFLEWDDVESGEPSDVSVQSLYARGCREWADVEVYMKSRQMPVWWWGQPEIMEDAQRRFVAYVIGAKPQQPDPSA